MQKIYISPIVRDDSLLKTLPASEQKRISYFPTEKRRLESLSSSLLLSAVLKKLNYNHYNMGFDSLGKPYLMGIDLFHNTSHNENYVICGISTKNQIGVDIEKITASRLRVAKKVCTPEELLHLNSLSLADQAFEFTKLWTLKEAFSKMLGVGLLLSFTKVSVIAYDDYFCIRHKDDIGYASIIKFDNHLIAICIKNEKVNITLEMENILVTHN